MERKEWGSGAEVNGLDKSLLHRARQIAGLMPHHGRGLFATGFTRWAGFTGLKILFIL